MNKKLTTALLSTVFPAMSMVAAVPSHVNCEVRPMYGYLPDGGAGRIVKVAVSGQDLDPKIDVETVYKKARLKTTHNIAAGDTVATFEVMLPAAVPTDRKSTATVIVAGKKYKVDVDPMRHWTVYIYNHAHVDIGYTNTHKNIEILHKSNVVEGMALGNETSGYPEGSRFVWNPEVTWPIERLLHSDPSREQEVVDALKKGSLAADASYVNLNTSICADEEMFHIFDYSRKLQKMSGVPADVFQQFDIPGVSWGLVPVMAQQGVKYVVSWPNTDRGGNDHSFGIDGMPFWWVGPDGVSKVLFLQPGRYANSGSMDKGWTTGRPWFGQRDARKVPARIEQGDANVDFTPHLTELESQKYPYDLIVLSWTLWDNCPLDADVPHAVKRWNDRYAYPHIIISGGHEFMSEIEKRYGDKLPVVTGDYTEYWTDGLGSAAQFTAMNRRNKERIIQAETAWSMLSDGAAAPRDEMNEGWRNVMMGSEHTWDFENPWEPYFHDALWKSKQAYFHEAETRSEDLLDEALGHAADKSNGALGPGEGPSNGGITVYNTQSWPHVGLVTLTAKESRKGDKVVGDDGVAVPSQRLSTGELVFMADAVPALGSRHYRVVEGGSEAPATPSIIDGNSISNGIVTVSISPENGNIVSLTREGDSYNYIDTAVDGGANSCSWLPANVDAPVADSVLTVSVTERGPLVNEITVTSAMKGCRGVTRRVRLVAGMPWVEMTNTVDKLPLLEKDGIHFGFGFNIPDSRTMIDIPWGVMEVEKDQWAQANRHWMAMQRWVDVSNDIHGVAWCSLDAPLMEYGGRTANFSQGWGPQGPWKTKLDPSSTVYSWVMNNHWHTNFPLSQDGPVDFRYRLMPHGAKSLAEVNRFGLEQAQPLLHVTSDRHNEVIPPVAVDNENVYITIVKSTDRDNEMIVRLRSLSPSNEQVNLTFPQRAPSAVNLCTLEEIPSEPVDGALTMNPYGMATVKVKF